MAQQYIFQMQGLTKTFPGGKKIFENIWLSFYNDAKIGVVGVNGSGKSTLLKIMAGLDSEFNGEARAADGIKRGYLEQEPQLNDSLNVRENVEAWCEEKQWVTRFNAIAMEPMGRIAGTASSFVGAVTTATAAFGGFLIGLTSTSLAASQGTMSLSYAVLIVSIGFGIPAAMLYMWTAKAIKMDFETR